MFFKVIAPLVSAFLVGYGGSVAFATLTNPEPPAPVQDIIPSTVCNQTHG